MAGRAKGVGRRTVLRAGVALAAAPLTRVLRAGAATAAAPDADVCIIGSGPAGAILACALTRRGLTVTLVESGPARGAPRDPRVNDLDIYSSIGAIDYPLASTRFRGAGGTSNLWSGACPRLHPIDFEPNAYTPRHAPWPIRYADLEPYYLGAEVELRVQGVDVAPHAPPRRDPFPRSEHPPFPNIQELMRRRGADLALHRLPRSRGENGVGVRIAVTHLPELAASPNALLVTDATATRVVCDTRGRVEGIRLENFTDPPRVARARAYVIACGGVESARLLLLSRSAHAPHGLGNRSDQVGRNFMEHPLVVRARATIDADWGPRPGNEWVSTEEFLEDAKQRGLGGLRIRVVADTLAPKGDQPPHRLAMQVRGEIECEPSPLNRISLSDRRDALGNPTAQLALDFTDTDRRTIRHAETLVWQVLAQLGIENPTVTVGPQSWDHHHMGTCRMGDDPRTSVVDRDLRVHGTENLYVASSAVFVTSGVSNPTLTITALSLRLADHLRETLGAC